MKHLSSYARMRTLIWLLASVSVLSLAVPSVVASADTEEGNTATATRTIAAGTPQLNATRHLLASGDYILVQLYDGKRDTEYKLQVDANGAVALPLVGQVDVGGQTASTAAETLTAEFQVYYRNPYVQVQLLEYGEIEVFVFGTDQPGQTFKLPNGSRLLDLLTRQSLTDDGHYRCLTLVRGGFDYSHFIEQQPTEVPLLTSGKTLALPAPGAVSRKAETSLAGYTGWRGWIEQRKNDPDSQVWVIDPLTLTVEGELSSNNLELLDRDVLFIPAPERLVRVTGVARPGYYELLDGETLGDLLRWAGSINFNADLINTTIKRYDSRGCLNRIVLNLSPALSDLSLISGFTLEDRDHVIIAPPEQRIFVLGAVNLAGVFDFAEDSTVLDYIAQAGGEDDTANLAWIAIIRQSRDRLNPLAPAAVIQANFKEIHAGLPLCTDLSLEPGDVIYVPPKGFEFKFSDIISSVGTVITSFAVVENTTKN